VWNLACGITRRVRAEGVREQRAKKEEVTVNWRTLHSEELHGLYLYVSPNIMWVVKSREMRLAGHAARMGEFWWGKHE
jgi:hypothetical protein